MIVAPVDLLAYRMLTPRWSFQPLSGAGAAREGGRFNRPRTPALYLSLEPETAVAEFSQAEPLFSPGVLACFRIRVEQVADLREGYNRNWDPLWREWDCEWKRLWFIEGISASPIATNSRCMTRRGNCPRRRIPGDDVGYWIWSHDT